MESVSLVDLVAEQLDLARQHDHGRAAHTLHGGRGHTLRQTVLALLAGHELAEHDNPGEATLQVLAGHVQLTVGDQTWEGEAGDVVTIPPARHALTAFTDAAVLLTMSLPEAAVPRRT